MKKEFIFLFPFLFLQQFSLAQNNGTLDYYSRIGLFFGGFAEVEQNDKIGFINTKGELVVPCIYDAINARDISPVFAYGVIPVKRFLWGAIDTTGKIIIPFVYDVVSDFWDNGISIVTKQHKKGCINNKGEIVVPFIYDKIWCLTEGVRQVKYNGKMGYLDSNGKQIIPCKYDSALECKGGLIPVMKGLKWGFINKKDSIIIPFVYDKANCFSEGLSVVSLKDSTGFIDQKNNIVIPFVFSNEDYYFSNGYARVIKNGRTGMIDKTGKVIIPFEYDDHGYDCYSHGYFIVEKVLPKEPQKFALIDSLGKNITGYIYDFINFQCKNNFMVEKEPLNGATDNTGKVIVPFEYKEPLKGAIDNTGKVIAPIEYSEFWDDNYHWAVAVKQDTLFYLNSTGKPTMQFVYMAETMDITNLNFMFLDTVAVAPYHDSWRLINLRGQFIDHFKSNGKVRLYYENRVLGTKGKLINYYKTGKWKTRYENGRMKEVTHYKNGQRNGEFKHWDPSGFLIQDFIYKNNKVVKFIHGF